MFTRSPRWIYLLLLIAALCLLSTDNDLARVAGSRDRAATIPRAAAGERLPPNLKSKVPPVYPEEARAAELEAETILQIQIRKDGSVDPDAIDCFRCTVSRRDKEPEAVLHGWCEDFCAASMAAVAQWTYEPGTEDGEPTTFHTTVVVAYELE